MNFNNSLEEFAVWCQQASPGGEDSQGHSPACLQGRWVSSSAGEWFCPNRKWKAGQAKEWLGWDRLQTNEESVSKLKTISRETFQNWKGKGGEKLQYLRTVEQLCVSTYGRNTRLRGWEQTQYLKQKKWHFKLP